MAHVHNILINENDKLRNNTVSATRTSETRVYRACIVATAVPYTIEKTVSELMRLEADKGDLQVVLDIAMAAHRINVKEAEVRHEAEAKTWHDARRIVGARIREELNGAYLPNIDGVIAAKLKADGLSDPYDLASVYSIVKASSDLATVNHKISRIKESNLKAGDQVVVSWHSTEAQAQDHLMSGDSAAYIRKGFRCEVRTDIVIKEIGCVNLSYRA